MGGVSRREKGLLKLVHPGRHVEIYKEPITAAEIMRKYPRHSIARPDVFQFPWIVVRPESLLFPGKVFFLIPNRTLYDLLKSKGLQTKSSSRENQTPRNHHHHHHLCYTYTSPNPPFKCLGGKTRNSSSRHYKCQQDNRGIRRRSTNMLLQDRTNSHERNSDSETSYADAWTEITDKIRKVHVNSAYPLDSSFESCRYFRPQGFHSSGSNHRRSSGAQTRVKSCLRKQDSSRMLLNLKVTFGSPVIFPSTTSPPDASSSSQKFRPWEDFETGF